MLRLRGGYQNGNHHFYTIKCCNYLVDGQNDHQLKSVRYGWVVSGHFVHLPLPMSENGQWWVTVFVTQHRATTLQQFGKYWKAVLTRFHHDLTKCRVEVNCNTDWFNVDKLSTLNWAVAVHLMWTKCPHEVIRKAEDSSGEWRFASFTASSGHFDHLILGVPFSLHGFPAPPRRRFSALPCGVMAVYPMQTVFQFSRFSAGFGNKKSPHNNLNLTIPSGMALVRVCYVAIES